MKRRFEQLHDAFVTQENDAPKDITPHAHAVQKNSFGVHLAALSLSKMGDALFDIKLVLPWLLTSIGAPVYFIAWLVPLRESLALLPQLFVAHWTQSFPVRKYLWSLGCAAQGLSVVLMSVVPWCFKGKEAGWSILILLMLFSLARCLCSIVIKDVQGKTIDKQRRGRVSGLATSLAGITAILFAIALKMEWLSSESTTSISILLACAGILWLIAAAAYWQLPEFPSDRSNTDASFTKSISEYLALLKLKPVQHFLVVRALLTSTALVAPFYVLLANRYSEGTISALGTLLLLAGLANLISGWFWGKLADLSSRIVMCLAGTVSFLLALQVSLGIILEWSFSQSHIWYGIILFFLYISHAGVRLGRATYLMDMAKEHNRSQLVALSNTIIGIVLLLAGSMIAILSTSGTVIIILGLGLCSLIAVILAFRLSATLH